MSLMKQHLGLVVIADAGIIGRNVTDAAALRARNVIADAGIMGRNVNDVAALRARNVFADVGIMGRNVSDDAALRARNVFADAEIMGRNVTDDVELRARNVIAEAGIMGRNVTDDAALRARNNMLFVNSDVYAQLRPRNVDRKERHPGARERNSNKRQRLQDKRKIPPENAPRSRATEPQFHPTYSHDSAVKDFGRHETCSEQNEQQKVTSYYQELSTIEAIRKGIDKTSRAKSAPSANIPNWMLTLDINLDVSSVDIIPPYDDGVTLKSRASETFSERASLTFVENNSEDNIDNLSDSKKDYLEAVPNENENIHQEKAKSVPIPNNKKREVYADTSVWPKQNKSARPLSNTFRIATPFSAGWTNTEDTGPRRYQGDKKVMSMQQGGIRSTPMQPKSKKYINQMLTFHHMKHHEKKIRLAKHRKRLVDQRISDSWSMSSNTPTPMTQRRFHNDKNVTSSDSQNVTTRRNVSNEDTSETKQTKHVSLFVKRIARDIQVPTGAGIKQHLVLLVVVDQQVHGDLYGSIALQNRRI
ncbi:hypothetical protein MAR_012816 [Mya arenaria]|uniref:Uncharacterized protein n=1 Tax=Mya arenaria TaxID=6604 RepID=A0ABY7FY72_MYAAR|nr:hypothetical protein MAR_012816 [Mya arenaria]